MRTTKPILTLAVVALLAVFSLADTPTTAPAKPKSKPAKPAIKPATPAKMLLKEIPRVSLVKVPLMRVLKQYEKLSGLTVWADWNALKDVGIRKDTPVTLKAGKIRFDKLLDLTLNSIAPKGHPLSWYLDRNVVKVSTQMRVLLRNRIALLPLKETKSSRPRPAPAWRRRAPLREINFSQLALKNAVGFLRDLSGANFHVNWRALETVGVTRETPVTVKVKNVSIARVLDLVTEQLSAGRDRYSSVYWLVQGGVVEISTGEALDRTTSVRVYEIGDLLTVIPNFKGPNISLRTTGNNNTGNNNTMWPDDDDDDDDDDEDDPKKQREKIRKTLIEIIMFSIGEDMWAPTGKGSIKILRNKMIISQTPLGFKLLERSMRR